MKLTCENYILSHFEDTNLKMHQLLEIFMGSIGGGDEHILNYIASLSICEISERANETAKESKSRTRTFAIYDVPYIYFFLNLHNALDEHVAERSS